MNKTEMIDEAVSTVRRIRGKVEGVTNSMRGLDDTELAVQIYCALLVMTAERRQNSLFGPQGN